MFKGGWIKIVVGLQFQFTCGYCSHIQRIWEKQRGWEQSSFGVFLGTKIQNTSREQRIS